MAARLCQFQVACGHCHVAVASTTLARPAAPISHPAATSGGTGNCMCRESTEPEAKLSAPSSTMMAAMICMELPWRGSSAS